MQRIVLPSALALAMTLTASRAMAKDPTSKDHPPAVGTLQIEPADIRLNGNIDAAQLAVSAKQSDGRPIDLTREANYQSLSPEIAKVNPAGLVRPTGNGQGRIRVRRGEQKLEIAVTVAGVQPKAAVSFRL